jgi:hypothetical protein
MPTLFVNSPPREGLVLPVEARLARPAAPMGGLLISTR